MNKQSRKLLPLASYSEVDVYNEYAFDGFAEKGTFVKVSVANFDNAGGIIGNAGVDINGVISPQWGSNLKVVPITAGDKATTVLGIMNKNVLQYDENGELLKYKKQKRVELDSVNSGESVPIIGRASRLTLGTAAYLVTGLLPGLAASAPAVTDVIVAAAGGKVNVVPAASNPSADLILGSVIGLTSQFGSGIVVRFK